MKGIQSSFIRKIFDIDNIMRFIFKTLVLVLLIITASRYQAVKDQAAFELKLAEIERDHANKVFSATIHAEVQRAIKLDPYKREAEAIAKVLYGTAKNSSAEEQRLVVWCVINRSEHYGYPNSIIEVCEQKSQWIGYHADNPIIESLYEVAYEELQKYDETDHRAVPKEYVFLSWSNSRIVLRDSFEENAGTHYWKA